MSKIRWFGTYSISFQRVADLQWAGYLQWFFIIVKLLTPTPKLTGDCLERKLCGQFCEKIKLRLFAYLKFTVR